MLSTTGPLVQAWFSRALAGRSPYRLYALSNFGSLVALVSYPFLFEPLFHASTQTRIWSGGFGVFAALAAGSALAMWRRSRQASGEPTGQIKSGKATLPVQNRVSAHQHSV